MKRTTCLIAALLALALVFTGYGFAPSNSVAPKATAEPAATPEEMMGTLEEKENAYVNPFLALRFAPGDDWTFFDREQLLEANGAVSGLLTDEDMAEQLEAAMEEGKTFYTMYAANESGETCSMMFQRLSAAEALFGQARATLEASLEPSVAQMESMGLTGVTGEVGTVTIDGTEYPCLQIRGKLGGRTICSDTLAFKEGNVLAWINITALTQKNLGRIYDAWQAVEEADGAETVNSKKAG